MPFAWQYVENESTIRHMQRWINSQIGQTVMINSKENRFSESNRPSLVSPVNTTPTDVYPSQTRRVVTSYRCFRLLCQNTVLYCYNSIVYAQFYGKYDFSVLSRKYVVRRVVLPGTGAFRKPKRIIRGSIPNESVDWALGRHQTHRRTHAEIEFPNFNVLSTRLTFLERLKK